MESLKTEPTNRILNDQLYNVLTNSFLTKKIWSFRLKKQEKHIFISLTIYVSSYQKNISHSLI